MSTPFLEEEEEKDDSFFILAMTATVAFILIIWAAWLMKNNHDSTGLTDFLAGSLKVEGGILPLVIAAKALKAKKRYSEKVKNFLVKGLGWAAILVAANALYLVLKRDNSACVVVADTVQQITRDVDQQESSYLKQIRSVTYTMEYPPTLDKLKKYRKDAIKQAIDEAHTPDYCKDTYAAIIDSIHQDALAKYCLKLEFLIQLTLDMNAMVAKGDINAVEPFLLQRNIDPQSMIVSVDEKGLSWTNEIRAYLKHSIDQNEPLHLRPLFKADRCCDDSKGNTLEFMII